MSTMTRKRRIGGTMAVDGSSAKAYVGYKSNTTEVTLTSAVEDSFFSQISVCFLVSIKNTRLAIKEYNFKLRKIKSRNK